MSLAGKFLKNYFQRLALRQGDLTHFNRRILRPSGSLRGLLAMSCHTVCYRLEGPRLSAIPAEDAVEFRDESRRGVVRTGFGERVTGRRPPGHGLGLAFLKRRGRRRGSAGSFVRMPRVSSDPPPDLLV